ATRTPESYTLSLHDALPICVAHGVQSFRGVLCVPRALLEWRGPGQKPGAGPWSRPPATDNNRLRPRDRLPAVDDDVAVRGEHDLDRKSTRLNSSHVKISYAV